MQAPAAKAVIPKSAVHGEGDDAYVFAVRDGKLERRAVSLGRGTGERRGSHRRRERGR